MLAALRVRTLLSHMRWVHCTPKLGMTMGLVVQRSFLERITLPSSSQPHPPSQPSTAISSSPCNSIKHFSVGLPNTFQSCVLVCIPPRRVILFSSRFAKKPPIHYKQLLQHFIIRQSNGLKYFLPGFLPVGIRISRCEEEAHAFYTPVEKYAHQTFDGTPDLWRHARGSIPRRQLLCCGTQIATVSILDFVAFCCAFFFKQSAPPCYRRWQPSDRSGDGGCTGDREVDGDVKENCDWRANVEVFFFCRRGGRSIH